MAAMTYSIVARDAETGQLGVAVQSAMFGAGQAVPWAVAGVGAVATQAWGEIAYGPNLLARLRSGDEPVAALAALLADDPESEVRQVGVVDASGRAAAHSGSSTIAEAGHVVGDGWSVQANMMAKAGVPEAMANAFRGGTGDLASRLLDALDAAEAEGGDLRGRQAAGLIVVEAAPADQPGHGIVVDVRVDDHAEPLRELRRLVELARSYRRLEEAVGLLTMGDAHGAIALAEGLHGALAAVQDRALLLISARLLSGDEDMARREVQVFPGDKTVLRRYLAHAWQTRGKTDDALLDRLFSPEHVQI